MEYLVRPTRYDPPIPYEIRGTEISSVKRIKINEMPNEKVDLSIKSIWYTQN